MALNKGEREKFIRDASLLQGRVIMLIALAAANASATQLLLGVNGIKESTKKLFDDFLIDVIDNP